MRRVTVMNRAQAEACIAMNGPIISINNKNQLPPDLSEFVDWYTVHFDDVTYPMDDTIMFNELHALYIQGVMHSIYHFDDVYVHCQAGISRSVAVGLYIAEKQDRLLVLSAASSTIGANQHVLNMLRREDREKELSEAFRL